MDSGAIYYVTINPCTIVVTFDYIGLEQLNIGNANSICIVYTGATTYPFVNRFNRPLLLKYMLPMPDIAKNLLSGSKFVCYNHVFFEFHPNLCFVKDWEKKEVLLKGHVKTELYLFDFSLLTSS